MKAGFSETTPEKLKQRLQNSSLNRQAGNLLSGVKGLLEDGNVDLGRGADCKFWKTQVLRNCACCAPRGWDGYPGHVSGDIHINTLITSTITRRSLRDTIFNQNLKRDTGVKSFYCFFIIIIINSKEVSRGALLFLKKE